jgi:hypothetical protein
MELSIYYKELSNTLSIKISKNEKLTKRDTNKYICYLINFLNGNKHIFKTQKSINDFIKEDNTKKQLENIYMIGEKINYGISPEDSIYVGHTLQKITHEYQGPKYFTVDNNIVSYLKDVTDFSIDKYKQTSFNKFNQNSINYKSPFYKHVDVRNKINSGFLENIIKQSFNIKHYDIINDKDFMGLYWKTINTKENIVDALKLMDDIDDNRRKILFLEKMCYLCEQTKFRDLKIIKYIIKEWKFNDFSLDKKNLINFNKQQIMIYHLLKTMGGIPNKNTSIMFSVYLMHQMFIPNLMKVLANKIISTYGINKLDLYKEASHDLLVKQFDRGNQIKKIYGFLDADFFKRSQLFLNHVFPGKFYKYNEKNVKKITNEKFIKEREFFKEYIKLLINNKIEFVMLKQKLLVEQYNKILNETKLEIEKTNKFMPSEPQTIDNHYKHFRTVITGGIIDSGNKKIGDIKGWFPKNIFYSKATMNKLLIEQDTNKIMKKVFIVLYNILVEHNIKIEHKFKTNMIKEPYIIKDDKLDSIINNKDIESSEEIQINEKDLYIVEEDEN